MATALCLLTLTHDRLEASPKTAADVSGPRVDVRAELDEDAARDGRGPAVGGLSGAACPRVVAGAGIMAA